MKILYIIIISLYFSAISFSQNYLTIKPDAIACYYGIDNESIFPIRIDSIKTHGDSIDYYSFCMIRPIPNSIYYTEKGPSWIGKKMVDCGNGINLFFNYENDTIFIKTNALLNESWRMYTYSNGDYLTATVSDIIPENFIGITDSVKTITLLLRNSLGVSLPGIINTYQYKLSKHYGFFIIPDFYNFPYHTGTVDDLYISTPEMEIIGISNPQYGWQNLTIADVFGMQTGDEIHYDYIHVNGPYPGAYSENRSIIKKYLNRHESSNHDTINFEIEVCQRSVISNMSETTTNYYHDTVSSTIIIPGNSFNYLPLEPFFDGFQWGYFNKIDTIGHRPNHVFIYDYNDSLVNNYLIDSWTDVYYYQNIGNETFHFNNYYNSDEDIQTYHYYNVNSVAWGTPYICDSLLASVNTIHSDNSSISIFPNPANNYIEIQLQDNLPGNVKIEIINSYGSTVYRELLSEKHKRLNTRNYPSGIYFIKVSGNNNKVINKKLIINH